MISNRNLECEHGMGVDVYCVKCVAARSNAIAEAFARALRAVEEERETHTVMLAELTALLIDAVFLHAAGDLEECHAKCREATGLSARALGESDAVTLLLGHLGYPVRGGRR